MRCPNCNKLTHNKKIKSLTKNEQYLCKECTLLFLPGNNNGTINTDHIPFGCLFKDKSGNIFLRIKDGILNLNTYKTHHTTYDMPDFDIFLYQKIGEVEDLLNNFSKLTYMIEHSLGFEDLYDDTKGI